MYKPGGRFSVGLAKIIDTVPYTATLNVNRLVYFIVPDMMLGALHPAHVTRTTPIHTVDGRIGVVAFNKS